MACLDQWPAGPHIKYGTGHRCDYYFECRGNEAAEQVRSKLREFGLAFERGGRSRMLLRSSPREHRSRPDTT